MKLVKLQVWGANYQGFFTGQISPQTNKHVSNRIGNHVWEPVVNQIWKTIHAQVKHDAAS